MLANNRVFVWFITGDFNATRSANDQRGRGTGERSEDFDDFTQFIKSNLFIDLPLCGRGFTWYCGDKVSMSPLHHFLLSEEWCVVWPNCIQSALQRGIFDHCSIVSSHDYENWGSRPQRMLEC